MVCDTQSHKCNFELEIQIYFELHYKLEALPLFSVW